MAVRASHDADALLDAARDLVLELGPRGAGIRDIARRSGAPTGSLYHRFGSRDAVIALAWLRAVRRFQAGFLAALGAQDPVQAVRDAVRWGIAFARDAPADTRLLLRFGQADLLDAAPDPEIAEQLSEVNLRLETEIRRLARRLFGTASAEARERATHAVIDLPTAALRRHVLAGTLGPRAGRLVEDAAVALVTDHQEGRS